MVGLPEVAYETMKYYEREWRIEQNRQARKRQNSFSEKQIFQTGHSPALA